MVYNVNISITASNPWYNTYIQVDNIDAITNTVGYILDAYQPDQLIKGGVNGMTCTKLYNGQNTLYYWNTALNGTLKKILVEYTKTTDSVGYIPSFSD